MIAFVIRYNKRSAFCNIGLMAAYFYGLRRNDMGVLESIGNQFCLDMLELSSDRICILDCEGRVHFANKAFRDKFVFEEDKTERNPL